MEWVEVASQLIEGEARPSLVFDETGRVQLVNTAFERLAAVSRSALVGRTWTDLLKSSHAMPAPSLEELKKRSLPQVTSLTLRSGRVLDISWTSSPIGAGAGVGTLVRIVNVRDKHACQVPIDLAFKLDSSTAMVLSEVASGGTSADIGITCFKSLAGRINVCEECPVPLLSETVGDERTTVAPRNARAPIRIVKARRVEGGSVAVSETFVDAETYSRIFLARVSEIGSSGRLTLREGQVLRELAVGRTLEDIASKLKITPRTAKFHKARILEKLGADSGTDLLRILS